MGRNVLRLNREQNFNWNAYKEFALGERMSVQIRSETYNVFNNTAFQDVDLTISAPRSVGTLQRQETPDTSKWVRASCAESSGQFERMAVAARERGHGLTG